METFSAGGWTQLGLAFIFIINTKDIPNTEKELTEEQ